MSYLEKIKLKGTQVKIDQAKTQLSISELCDRLSAMNPREVEIFNCRYEEHRRSGMGMDASAFMAYCEMKD